MPMIKRAQYTERGPNPAELINVVEFEQPALTNTQALVEVLAAPINPSDVLALTGQYGLLPPLPAIGGNEGVGRIIETGTSVNTLSKDQTVLLPVGCGSWSTHIVCEADTLIPLPSDTDPQQLSMMTVNPPTAALLLSEFVTLQPGDWVIQNAANSAVGGYLISLAKLRGYKTVNVVRRESAIANVKSFGGDVVLVDNPDLAEQIRHATNNADIKLAIDAVSGEATNHLAQSLSHGGTLVNYGMMSGKPCIISPREMLFNNITLQGFWLARWFKEASAEKKASVFGEITHLISSGKLRADIAEIYSIEQIKEAVKAASEGKRSGKIIVVP